MIGDNRSVVGSLLRSPGPQSGAFAIDEVGAIQRLQLRSVRATAIEFADAIIKKVGFFVAVTPISAAGHEPKLKNGQTINIPASGPVAALCPTCTAFVNYASSVVDVARVGVSYLFAPR